MARQWLVYLLQCSDNSYYCGITSNMERRVAQHNGFVRGGARYTAGRRPVKLLACLKADDRSHALKMERLVKKLPRTHKLQYFVQAVKCQAAK